MFSYRIVGRVSVCVFVGMLEGFEIDMGVEEDLGVGGVFGGVFMGRGVGMMFKFGGSRGGVEMMGRVMKKDYEVGMGGTMLMLDGWVITISLSYLN